MDPGRDRLHIDQSFQGLQAAWAARCVTVILWVLFSFSLWFLSKSDLVCPDSRIGSLQLTMTEVLKRQSSKSKKNYNQVNGGLHKLMHTLPLKVPLPYTPLPPCALWQHISVSEAKVDKVTVNGGDDGTTFAVCLDQDEKKFIQCVTRYNTTSSLTVKLHHKCNLLLSKALFKDLYNSFT